MIHYLKARLSASAPSKWNLIEPLEVRNLFWRFQLLEPEQIFQHLWPTKFELLSDRSLLSIWTPNRKESCSAFTALVKDPAK